MTSLWIHEVLAAEVEAEVGWTGVQAIFNDYLPTGEAQKTWKKTDRFLQTIYK